MLAPTTSAVKEIIALMQTVRAEPVWYLTRDGDKTCLEMYERHYSAYRYADGRKRRQCVGPGEVIFLRTGDGDAMFVWRKYIGFECEGICGV